MWYDTEHHKVTDTKEIAEDEIMPGWETSKTFTGRLYHDITFGSIVIQTNHNLIIKINEIQMRKL